MSRPRGTDNARVVQVIETTALRGDGSEKDPCRHVKQYWDFDGNLLAENDPSNLRQQFENQLDKLFKKTNKTEDGYDDAALVMPDEQSKTMIISSSVPDAVLKVNVKKAEALAMAIQDQIQKWNNETTTDKTEKGSYIPFHNEALKLARDDEKLIADAFVKTEGFDRSIVFFMSLCEQIWHVANKYKNFRMELFYDAEALNTNYAFFVPSTQSESDDKCPESLKNQD